MEEKQPTSLEATYIEDSWLRLIAQGRWSE